MSEKKGYYEILGVSKDASADQITAAYRALAMKYHPDRNKSFGAEEKMKEINEAYDILSDEQQRSSYHLKTGFGNTWQNKQADVVSSRTWSAVEDEFLFKNFLNMDDTILATNIPGKSKLKVRQRREHWGLIRPEIIERTSNEPRVQRIVFALRKGQKIICEIKVSGGNNDIYFSAFGYKGTVNSIKPKHPEMVKDLKSFGYQIGTSSDYCFYFSNSFSSITSKKVDFTYYLENKRKISLTFTI